MKKNTFTKQVLILFFLGCFNLAFAGGGGHGIIPICKDMHIEMSEDWRPGKTIEYSVNYSEKHPSNARQNWQVTGGSIISVNGRNLTSTDLFYDNVQYTANVYQYFSESSNYSLAVNFKDPTSITGDVSSSIFAILWGIAKDKLLPSSGEDPYVRIRVKWDPAASYASITCDSWAMGFSGLCGHGAETLTYSTDCLDNSVPVALTNDLTITPTCANNGAFRFVLPNTIKNNNITWTLPLVWKINKVNGVTVEETNTVSGPGIFSISGNVNFGGNPYLLAGLASVSVTRPCDGGTTRLTQTFPGESYFARTITPSSLIICPYKEMTVPVTITASEGKAPYTYQWSKANSGCTTGNGFGCTNMTYTSTEIMNEQISVKITDAKGCYAIVPVPYTRLDPNASWGAYQIFTNFVTETPAIDIDYTTYSDIVTDQVGNPYYVGTNGNIYTYQYVSTPYIGWKNTAVTTGTGTLATGQLATYENSSTKTVYYAKTDGSIGKATSTGGAWITSPVPGPAGVKGSIKVNSLGNLFYANSSNQIFSSINNYSSPVIPSILPDSKFAITNKYIYYFHAVTKQIMAVDYTTLPYTPISFANVTPQSQVLLGINLSDFVYQKYSDIDVDASGNAYFIGSDKALYQVNAGTPSLQKISSAKQYNGYLSTGLQTGVVYAAAIDKNIYQFVASNGDNPLLISFMYGNPASPIGNSWWFKQAGAIKFRNPNVFYISEDGTLKVILYNTAGICTPQNLRESDEGELRDISNSFGTSESNGLQNLSVYPNPFSQSATINYQLNTAGDVKIVLYNAFGESIDEIISDSYQVAGSYSKPYDNANLPAGLYICQLFVNGQKQGQVKLVVK